MITRTIGSIIKKSATKFPLIGIIGPRQSGKTTLVRALFPSYRYVSLEDLDNRIFAKEDPRGFLETYNNRVIIDEIQKVPELFSYLQTKSDEQKSPGQYIITGSQHFLLHRHISQTLAGRIALFILLPLSAFELAGEALTFATHDEYVFTGMYPRIYEQHIAPNQWYPNYIQTYIERDIRDLTHVSDLSLFQTFVKFCAGRVGQLLNLSSLARDCGISHNTARSWLSLLETSFIVFLLQPYHKNFGKRVVKMPKLYFYDTGLACSLLGLHNHTQLHTHYLRGSLFENFIITEYLKYKTNYGYPVNYFFWRDKLGHEIDLIIEKGDTLQAIEIKSGKTPTSDYFRELNYFMSLSSQKNIQIQKAVIYGGLKDQIRKVGKLFSWNHFIKKTKLPVALFK